VSSLALVGHPVDIPGSRRNVLTRGVDVNALVGRRFRVGDVLCAGRRLCEPCAHLDRLSGPGVLRPLISRRTARRVLTNGTISRSAAVVTVGTPPT
jgi:MOSC domain-containing protein YiiM